jgi:hypothetical protein
VARRPLHRRLPWVAEVLRHSPRAELGRKPGKALCWTNSRFDHARTIGMPPHSGWNKTKGKREAFKPAKKGTLEHYRVSNDVGIGSDGDCLLELNSE